MTEEMTGPAEQPPHPPATLADWLRIIIPTCFVAVFIVVAWRLGYFSLRDPTKLNAAADRVQDAPWLGPIFIAVYAAVAAMAAPVSPLAYAAGAVFGAIKGGLYVWIASLIGSAAGYALARTIWADSAHRILGRYRDKLRVMRDSNVFRTTLLVQLMPIVPFGIFNYAVGVSRSSFLPFIAGTALGTLPGSAAAAYVGDRIVAGIRGSDKHAFFVATLVLLLLLLVSFSPTLLRKLKR